MTPQDFELIEELGSYAYDPVGFARWAFPWGEPNTELARFKEPYRWQIEYLEQLGDGLRSGQPVLLATASGHGIGKSALNGMETWFGFSTFPNTRGVITANTENQLKTKTWVEIAKWHRLFIAKHLFKLTATSMFSVDEELQKEWRMDIVPWSERNTEAFAGLHNAGRRIYIAFDEASAIPDVIWETTEGALTDEDTEIIWTVKGNPTRNSGRFRDCFPGGKFAKRWQSREIDSRTVPGTNKVQIAKWEEDYGADSDFFRIRVLGKFPKNDQRSFISFDAARAAAARAPVQEPRLPVLLGVDVGRFGDDPSVIYPRQGFDAKSRPAEVYSGLNTMQLVERVMVAIARYSAAAVFVDAGGVGGGVVDRLEEISPCPVYGIDFGSKPLHSDPSEPNVKYANRRAEMWGSVRKALPSLAIPSEVMGNDLVAELTGPTYDYNVRDEIVLESKKDMKARGLASPNVADALALTYAMPFLDVAGFSTSVVPAQTEYDPYAPENA